MGVGILFLVLWAAMANPASPAGRHASQFRSPIRFRHEITALYMYDHNGLRPKSDVVLRSYSDPFGKIVDHCIVTAEVNTNLMIHLSDQATDLGGRSVTTLKILQATARRIDWTKPKINCGYVFDSAEGHAEGGEP